MLVGGESKRKIMIFRFLILFHEKCTYFRLHVLMSLFFSSPVLKFFIMIINMHEAELNRKLHF